MSVAWARGGVARACETRGEKAGIDRHQTLKCSKDTHSQGLVGLRVVGKQAVCGSCVERVAGGEVVRWGGEGVPLCPARLTHSYT